VAGRLTGYLSGVQVRLRAAELARVESQTKAAEERKRRRITAALEASVLVTASVIDGGWAYLARQRAARLPQQARAAVMQTLQRWKADTDLAGIREESALAKLPEDERKACRALWAEVEVVLKKAQSP